MTYIVYRYTKDGQERIRKFAKAPAASSMLSHISVGIPKGDQVLLATRWFPRLNVWRVYDVRDAKVVGYRKLPDGQKIDHWSYPVAFETKDEDAARAYCAMRV